MDKYTKKIHSLIKKFWNQLDPDNEPEEGWKKIEVDAHELMDLLSWNHHLWNKVNPDKEMVNAERIIKEAAKLIENPGEGNVVFTLRLTDNKSTLNTKAGKGVDPKKVLEKAIDIFSKELEDLKNCPVHNNR